MFGQQSTVGNNKQICNFYLKGNCKYGNKCWNLHPPNQGGTANTFLGKTAAPQDSEKEFQDFVKQVSGEMNQWERSGQWLVSSFSPIKGHPPFAGFNDTSPEEFRIKAYEALKSNTNSSYQAYWHEMQQRCKQLREAVKMTSPEALQAMRGVFFTKSSSETQSVQQQGLKPANVFGKAALLSTPSIFGGTSTQTNTSGGLLGAKPQSTVFGGTSTVFGGSQPASNVFGGNASKPVFGGQAVLGAQNVGSFSNQSSNVFGGSSNVFKSGTQGVQTNNLFGGNQNQTATGLFGNPSTAPVQGQSSIFGGQNKSTSGSSTQPSIFGGSGGASNTMATQGNIFGNQQQQPQQQTGLFGNPQTQQQQTTSVFGSSSVFGGASTQNPTTQPVSQAQPSVFGGAPTPFASTPTPFGTTPAATKSVFSGGTGFGGNGILGGTTTNSVFASATATNTGTPGLFGKPAESGTNFFGEAAKPIPTSESSISVAKGPECYTPMDQLKPEDKAQFEADEFTFIPLCPPPIELCA